VEKKKSQRSRGNVKEKRMFRRRGREKEDYRKREKTMSQKRETGVILGGSAGRKPLQALEGIWGGNPRSEKKKREGDQPAMQEASANEGTKEGTGDCPYTEKGGKITEHFAVTNEREESPRNKKRKSKEDPYRTKLHWGTGGRIPK